MPDAVPAVPATTAAPVTPAAPPADPAAASTPPAAGAPGGVDAATPPEQGRDLMAERFARLAREQKAIAAEKQRISEERRQAEGALKQREESLAAKIAKAEELEKAQAAALADPGSYLRRVYGDDWYDRLTQYKLEGEKRAPADMAVQALREDLQKTTAELRRELEERWKAVEEERKKAAEEAKSRAEAQEKQVVEQFRKETLGYVQANQEKYELIHLYDAGDLVVKTIEETFAKSQRLMTAEEAAEAVESYLEEQAAKFFSGKRWASRQQAQQTEQPSGAARTLTNGAGTGTSAPPDAKMDRYARAVAAMEAAAAAAAAKT